MDSLGGFIGAFDPQLGVRDPGVSRRQTGPEQIQTVPNEGSQELNQKARGSKRNLKPEIFSFQSLYYVAGSV